MSTVSQPGCNHIVGYDLSLADIGFGFNSDKDNLADLAFGLAYVVFGSFQLKVFGLVYQIRL